MTVISAVSDDVEYQVTKLMSTPYWTVVNHLFLCKEWIDLFMKLTKVGYIHFVVSILNYLHISLTSSLVHLTRCSVYGYHYQLISYLF